jgi:hypothetical protein
MHDRALVIFRASPPRVETRTETAQTIARALVLVSFREDDHDDGVSSDQYVVAQKHRITRDVPSSPAGRVPVLSSIYAIYTLG